MGNSVKKRVMAGLCILALAVGVFLGNSVQPVYTKSKLSALHVEGTKLCDKKGKVVQLRGVSTHGLSWYPEYVWFVLQCTPKSITDIAVAMPTTARI